MTFINNKSLGILGDGQLAQMLVASAHKLGLKTSIYSESKKGPASNEAHHHQEGSFKDIKEIISWAKTCDRVTFESEFIDLSSCRLKNIFPQPKNMQILRDRLSQKESLLKFKIPTSPFKRADQCSSFEGPLVFKKRLFGYDGYGTRIVKSQKDFKSFLENEKNLGEWIVEDFISFKRELAFSISRDTSNRFCLLPLVESLQRDAKCFSVHGPENNMLIKPLLPKIKKLLTSLDYIGIMAFELFETKDGKIYVNEVAPRVHNSAHYSIEALSLSQFDVHILSIFNQELPRKIEPLNPFAMVNLIGTKKAKPFLTLPQKGSLHWYRKKQNRPGRKMGHITVLDKTAESALKSALKEEKRQNL